MTGLDRGPACDCQPCWLGGLLVLGWFSATKGLLTHRSDTDSHTAHAHGAPNFKQVRRVARGILCFLTCGPFARNASLPDSYRILPPVTLYLNVHVETGYGVAGGGHWRCLRWSPAMPDATPTTEQKRASGERPGEAGLCRPLRLDEQLRLGLL